MIRAASLLFLCAALLAAAAPLTQAQLEALLAAKTPDAAIAAEIDKRGIATGIDARRLRAAGAGPKTLAALGPQPPNPRSTAPVVPRAPLPTPAPAPLLPQAQRELPPLLVRLYDALTRGSSSEAAAWLSPQLAGDAPALDRICPPFAYRAHMIDAIIERPGGIVATTVRILFDPLRERVYTLTWRRAAPANWTILAVDDPGPEWSLAWRTVATDKARGLFQAIRAARADLISGVVSSGVPTAPLVRSCIEPSAEITELQTSIVDASGLHVRVHIRSDSKSLKVLVDSENRVVQWELDGYPCRKASGADPRIASWTLARYGLDAAPEIAQASYADLCKAAVAALARADYEAAAASLLDLTARDPDPPQAWALLGHAQLGRGQHTDAAAAWDAAMARGGAIPFAVAHERNFDFEAGHLILTTRTLAFRLGDNEIFSSSIPDLGDVQASDGGSRVFSMQSAELGKWAYVRVKVRGKAYNFDPIPSRGGWEPRDWYVCARSAEALAEQRFVSEYIRAAIIRAGGKS